MHRAIYSKFSIKVFDRTRPKLISCRGQANIIKRIVYFLCLCSLQSPVINRLLISKVILHNKQISRDKGMNNALF